MKRSQTPASWRRVSGWAWGLQLLKSPTTYTCVALGAQTAKWTPATPFTSRR
jgi:hypothetical protein